jgi:molecular chaperone GrpE
VSSTNPNAPIGDGPTGRGAHGAPTGGRAQGADPGDALDRDALDRDAVDLVADAELFEDLVGDGLDGAEAGPDEPVDPLTEALIERDEYLASLQRLQADFENFKKRVQRTHLDEVARASGDLVARLLVVLDTLDLAQAHLSTSEDASTETSALLAARAQLLDVLVKEGLTRIDEVGAPFDPTVHDAVAHAPGGDDEGTTVDEVLRAGYGWRGQVLRPAMVRVRG